MATGPTIILLKYNWWTDRASAPIVAIVAHNTVGTDSRGYLSRGGNVPDGSDFKVSIHSLIRKDGTLYRYVPDERGANHAGFGIMPPQFPRLNPNRCTIGFELESRSDGKGIVDTYTPAQLLTMGWEINRIRDKYGALPILRHGDIDPKRRSDPVGLSVEEMEQWAVKARLFYQPTPVPPPVSLPPTPPQPKQYRVAGVPVYQRSDKTGALWGYLHEGEVVEIDNTENGHLRDGRGFVDMRALEGTQ